MYAKKIEVFGVVTHFRRMGTSIAYEVLDVWKDNINILDGKNPPTAYNINDMKNNEDDDYNTKGQHANDWSTRWEHAKSIIAPHHTFDMQLV